MAKRKSAAKSPMELSLKLLGELGYTRQKVEHWNPFAGRRQDLFGVIDIVAVKSGEVGVLGVQCTTASNVSEHIRKVVESREANEWLRAGNKLAIHGWDKKKVKNKWQYTLREERFTTLDKTDVPSQAKFRERTRATGCKNG